MPATASGSRPSSTRTRATATPEASSASCTETVECKASSESSSGQSSPKISLTSSNGRAITGLSGSVCRMPGSCDPCPRKRNAMFMQVSPHRHHLIQHGDRDFIVPRINPEHDAARCPQKHPRQVLPRVFIERKAAQRSFHANIHGCSKICGLCAERFRQVGGDPNGSIKHNVQITLRFSRSRAGCKLETNAANGTPRVIEFLPTLLQYLQG